ncbi:MAG: electron transfer flavoprotein subunit beta/FixA family protein [Armatimonadota bacterium]
MKIIVLAKQVPDTEANIRINSNGTNIETSGIKFVLNPYDEYAMEEALRIKQANPEAEITAITMGGATSQEVLRNCLALGATKAVRVKTETESTDSYSTALILSKAIEKLGYDIILTGKQAVDDGAMFVPGAISSLLNIPFVSSAIKIDISDKNCSVRREIEGNTEVIECSLPAIISAEKGLNQPRYASLMGIMQAKKKPIEELTITDLGISQDETRTRTSKLEYPPQRKQGEILEGEAGEVVTKLVEKLKEAKVL